MPLPYVGEITIDLLPVVVSILIKGRLILEQAQRRAIKYILND